MKKIISVVLLCALVFNSVSITVWAEEYDSTSEAQKNESEEDSEYSDFVKYMYKFTTGSSYKYLVISSNFSYMKFVSEFRSNVAELYLIEMVDRLAKTGAAPDVNAYIEALANIITIYDRENASFVAEQKKMDNLKDWRSYTGDVISIATDAVSVYTGLYPSDSEIADGLETAIDVLTTEYDNINNWIDTLTNLETVLQDYSNYDSFLEIIEDNADGDLKEAASSMRNSMRKMLLVKLGAYAETEKENLENYTEFFYDKYFFNLARKSSYYTSDEAFKFGIDAGEKIFENEMILLDAWDLGVNIGKLAGNILVGGENLIKRVIEMEALYDISLILQENILTENNQFVIDYNQQKLHAKDVQKLEEMLRFLLATRQRGEYCIWNVVVKDGGMLSYFAYKSKEQANQWYQSQVNILSDLKDSIPRNEDQKIETLTGDLNGGESSSDISETENTDIKNKYLEFIEQYKGKEAFYSIQNIKEGGKPILLVVSSLENAENDETIDDKNIYSKQCDVYDYVNGEIVQVGSIFSLSGYLSLYTKDAEYYIATRINTHSVYFTCIKDNKLYTYGYNTNNIVEDTVQNEEDGEYYDYAYGTRNYDDAIGEYSEVGEIVFKKILEDKTIANDETESDENDASTAYRNLIEKYETEYGSASLNEQEQFWTGLCFAKLLDFNGDGVDELILAYQTETSNVDNVEYTVELWEFDGSSAEKVASQISWTGNNIPYFGGFAISKYEEKYLLILTDNAGGDVSYYGTKDDGSIGLVHRLIWKGDIVQGDWYLDDEKISREIYEDCYNKYRADATWYGFSEESCNETIKREISQTKDKLKM